MLTIHNLIERIRAYYNKVDNRSTYQIMIDTRRARRLERYKKYNYIA